jgi:hypothetical protein
MVAFIRRGLELKSSREEFEGRDIVGKERGSWLCFEVTEFFVHSTFVNRIVLYDHKFTLLCKEIINGEEVVRKGGEVLF